MRVIACPHCDMKYRIDPAKFKQDELKIRCKSCNNSFGVNISDPESQSYPIGEKPSPEPQAAAAPEPPAPEPPKPQPESTQQQSTSASPSATSSDANTILIAHAQAEVRDEIVSLLEQAGFSVTTVKNGVDALMQIEQNKPKLAILDVALPKMFGFEVCEVVRRDEALDGVKLVLIAAIYDKARYKRSPTQLYGADDYIEKHALAEELVGKCNALIGGAAPQSTPEPPQSTKPPASEPQSEAPQSEDSPPPPSADIDEADLERARRLARTIISDIALYNAEKLEDGVRNGNASETLEAELQEGRDLFDSRIDESVRDAEPFLHNALDAFVETKKQELGLG